MKHLKTKLGNCTFADLHSLKILSEEYYNSLIETAPIQEDIDTLELEKQTFTDILNQVIGEKIHQLIEDEAFVELAERQLQVNV